MEQLVTMFPSPSKDAPVPLYPYWHLQSVTLETVCATVVGAPAGHTMHAVALTPEKEPTAHVVQLPGLP